MTVKLGDFPHVCAGQECAICRWQHWQAWKQGEAHLREAESALIADMVRRMEEDFSGQEDRSEA